MNLNLNNVVIIADSIVFDCPNVNANYSTNAADFVGTVSEPLNIPKDEWQYMKDENGNGLPDFFEDFDNWEKLADTDGDGLPDSIEEYLGSDSNNIDTDGDGLGDYYEVFVTYTDPTMADTDENGVSDADEDFDEDGLTNLDEFLNNTYPYIDDSDNDGLSDGSEVNNFGTDPLVADTDGDELEDGDEIILGTNPLKQDTNDNGIIDSKEKIQQTYTHKVTNEACAVTEVIVDMECTGNINRTTSVESIMGKHYLCTEVVGLVGEPFEIETSSEFDTATLTFTIDKSKLGDTEFDNLMFLWYNEEKDEFVELETFFDVENSKASIITTHFSKYMIVDSAAWFNAWRNAPDYREGEVSQSVDTVITIDVSGSMSASDIAAAVTATKNYIATMRNDDRLAIVKFSNNATVLQGMTNDKQKLYDALNGLKSSGGTYYCKAIKATIDAFDDTANTMKIAIFMSDGEPSDNVSDTLYKLISDSNVIFHCVGYGKSNRVLNKLSDAGNGNVYTASTTEDLIAAYEEITLFSGMSTVDNDEDGLYDVLEDKGMILSNGNTIFTDPFKIDTDGDGLIDGSEIRLKKCNYTYQCFEFELVDGANPLAGDYENTGKSDYDRVNSTDVFGKSFYISSMYGDIISIPAGTVAYGYPNSSCGEAFVTKETNQNFQYHASALIYANGEYWIKVNSGDFYGVWGYVLCDDNQIDITSIISGTYLKHSSAAPDIICTNGKIVAYDQWFYPMPGMIGVTRPIPRFIQKQYGPCMALSIMMGAYYMSETSQSPNEFLKRYIGVYYSENGVARWNSTINKSVITNAHTPQESLDEIRQQLNEHKPVIISGNDGTAYGDHFVLVVGYVNDGMALSDYIVIDPYHTFDFPRTMDDFYAPNHYPNPCKQIGLTYEILVFNSRWEISEALGQ